MRSFQFFFLFIFLFVCACTDEQRVSTFSDTVIGIDHGLPVGFDRQAGYVVFDEEGVPFFNRVETAYPVLHFTGGNLDRSMIAYTALAKLNMDAPRNREPVSLHDSLELTLDDLVPTGELVVEKDGEASILSKDGEFATFATWSPTDPNVIAYTTARGNGEYGFVTMDVRDGNRLLEVDGVFAPDYLAWSDDGKTIGLYGSTESNNVDTGSAFYEEELENDSVYSFLTFDVMNGERLFDTDEAIGQSRIRPSVFDLSMNVEFENGGRMITDHFLGGEKIVFESKDGIRRVVKAEQIRHRSGKGVAYVNTVGNLMSLYATNGKDWSGESDGAPPPAVMSATSVTYYIPMPSGSTVTFTQVGVSYSGSGCNVSSHTSSSGMGYAIDIQLSGSTYDEVLASGTGGTYSFYASSRTVNCGDSSGCSYYSSTYTTGTGATSCNRSSSSTDTRACNSSSSYTGYGWGNYVILVHSDGYYTRYTHMEYSNFQVVTSASMSASAGCWLGDEGYTGNTCGSKNGCGDHLHFQKQSSGSRSASSSGSVSVSFSEDSSITSRDCTTKTPTLGAMSCSL